MYVVVMVVFSVRDTVVPGLIDKAIAAARGTTRQKSFDALLLFMEVQTPDPVVVRLELFLFVLHSFQKVNSMCSSSCSFLASNLNGIQEQLLLGLDKKQPKIVAACVSILAEAVKYNSSLFSFFFSFFFFV